MYKADAKEAAGVCDTVLQYMLQIAPTSGRIGSALRTAINTFLVNAETLIQNDISGVPLDALFVLAWQTGITRAQMSDVRRVAVGLDPWSLGGTLIKNSLINFAIATEARILVDMNFVSRETVDLIKKELNEAFTMMEDIAADDMDQMTYQDLLALHASTIAYLTAYARPLPRMLQYHFNQALPSLVTAYRLYADANRADELRNENRIIHPAFCPMNGMALTK